MAKSGFRCVMVMVAVLSLLGGPALAAPSFLGYTGLVRVPTADALDQKDYNLAAFALNLEEGGDSNVYAANLGVAQGLEVGFARVKPEEGSGETYLNAKYRFSAETAEHPAVAAGVADFTDEIDTTVYVVMSKAFGHGYQTSLGEITSPRFHVGVGGGMLSGVFGGVTAVVGDRLMLMVEYDTDDVNIGARLALSTEIRADVGFLDGFDDVGIGLSYNKSF